MSINKQEAEKQINQLKQHLNEWNYQYYVLEAPTVSDEEFDSTLKQLNQLEQLFPELITFDSPTQKVAGEVSEKFKKVVHTTSMLSLANAFNYNDLVRFDEQVKNLTGLQQIDYFCELKIDGLSISLTYENSELKIAATRGDGSTGEEVTTNIKQIKSIPLWIGQEKLIVRGEIYLSKKEFAQINQLREENDEPLFANPRNATSGTIRQLDSSIVGQRKLNAFLYYYVNAKDYNITTQYDAIKALEKLKFKVNQEYRLCSDIVQIWEYINHYQDKRHDLDYEIDGIVIKVNNLNVYEQIGYTNKNPKWAIAYKLPSEIVTTKLLNIFTTVGRTGKITYNAELLPVRIAGTTVKAATLHNADFIQSRDIRINDFVNLKKAGDIIPEIIEPILQQRSLEAKIWFKASNCPNCDSILEQNIGEVDQYCINATCSKKIIRTIEHFVSRNAMNIEGVSKKIIAKLYDLKLLTCFSDFYTLYSKKDVLINLDNFGLKSFSNMINAIENSKSNSLERLIFGLGIRHVGNKTSKVLAKKFKEIDNLIVSDYESLSIMEDIGPVIAQNIIDYFKVDANLHQLEQLKYFNVNMSYVNNNSDVQLNTLANLRFVITGTLSQSREYFKEQIELHGGKVSDAVSSKTSYLLTGSDDGSKIDKAMKLNVKIINEKQFYDLIS